MFRFVFCVLLGVFAPVHDVAAQSAPIRFLRDHCVDCHEGESSEAGFDVTAFLDLAKPDSLNDPSIIDRWVQIVDRVEQAEMPPPEATDLSQEDRQQFVSAVSQRLRQIQLEKQRTLGRVQARRLTNDQLERTLQDLLLIDVPLARLMPPEQRHDGFVNLADAQPMSHFQLQSHLIVVDAALDAAWDRATLPANDLDRHYEVDDIVGKRRNQRNRDPELRKGLAVTWSHGLIFYGRISSTEVKRDGWYRITMTASAVKPPENHGVWCSVRSGPCVSSAPLLDWLGCFEATEEPKTMTYDAWLPAGHMLEVRPADVTLKKIKTEGGQVGVGEGESQDAPGVALHSLHVQQIHPGGTIDEVRDRLFSKLSMKWDKNSKRSYPDVEALNADARRQQLSDQLTAFASRAFRRPADPIAIESFVNLAIQTMDASEQTNPNAAFAEGLRAGMRAILCSPRFLYFVEPIDSNVTGGLGETSGSDETSDAKGQLDHWAIASRLSYFLTGSAPDDNLRQAAQNEKLSDAPEITNQVERLLQTRRGERFISDFADQWLDLINIDFTEPDRRLFPEFDNVVKQSMLDETRLYLKRMLDEDRPIRELVDSNATYLNERLARYYGIQSDKGKSDKRKSVAGDAMKLVTLDPQWHRGGLLGHGSILKVTANGNDTSPVLRGIWVSERLLGCEIPPPPANVPAVEPDIRGATTIRELLAKHQSDESCAGCHRKIDPPGFALENFDAGGRWRDRYLQLVGKRHKPGAMIEPGFVMSDGESFDTFDDFKSMLAKRDRQLAKSFAEHLVVYATGAELSFVDRMSIDQIVDQTKEQEYGFRSILRQVVLSDPFLKK